jgi:DNA replication protein DnaC
VEACTFENYLTPEQWQAEAKNTAKRFLGDYRGHWLIACGSVGSGKSHLCTAICAELIDSGNDVRYMMWMDESTRLKAMITEADDYDHFVNQLKKVDVLYIDDLFKTEQGKQPTSADVRLAFEILNHRYANRKTTIISTERTVKSLLEIDEAVGSRIYEMTKGYCISISGSKNWRLK